MAFRVPPDEFDRMVVQAVENLPAEYLEIIRNANLDIVPAPRPSPQKLAELGIRNYYDLLGLYEGYGYGDGGPNKITIYQHSIEYWSCSLEDLKNEIAINVLHEVGHFFGFDDEQLEEMGLG